LWFNSRSTDFYSENLFIIEAKDPHPLFSFDLPANIVFLVRIKVILKKVQL